MNASGEKIKGSIASNLRRSLIVQNFEIPGDSSSRNDKNCAVCQAEFGKIGIIHAKKNTCKFCNRGVCSKCSPEQLMHPGTKKLERICSACLTRMMESHFSQDFQKKIQDLKEEKKNREEEMKFMKYEKEMDMQENKAVDEKIRLESQSFEEIRIKFKKNLNDLQEKQEELRISLRALYEKKEIFEKENKDFQESEKEMILELTRKIMENDENFKVSESLHEKIDFLKKEKKKIEGNLKEKKENSREEQEKELEISNELEVQENENFGIQRENLETLEEMLELIKENHEIEERTLKMSVESELHEKILQMEKSSQLGEEILKELSSFQQKALEIQAKNIESKDHLLKQEAEKTILTENLSKIKEEQEKTWKDLNLLQSELIALRSLNDSQKQDFPVLSLKSENLQQSKIILLKSIEDNKQHLINQVLIEKSQQLLNEIQKQDKENEEVTEENKKVLQEIEKINEENLEIEKKFVIEELTSVLFEKHEDLLFNKFLESWTEQEKIFFQGIESKLTQNIKEDQENHEKLTENIKNLKESNKQVLISSAQSSEILQSLESELKNLLQSSKDNKDLLKVLNSKIEENKESKKNISKRLKETQEILTVLEKSEELSLEYENQSRENEEVSKENFEIFEEIQKLIIENILIDKKTLELEVNQIINEKNAQIKENSLLEQLVTNESSLLDLKSSETTKKISELSEIKQDLDQKSTNFKSQTLLSTNDCQKLQEISESLIQDLSTLKETQENNLTSLSDLQKQLIEVQEFKVLLQKSIQDNENLILQAMTEKIEKYSNQLDEQNFENHLIRTENSSIINEIQKILQENDEVTKIILLKEICDSQQDRKEIIEQKLEFESKISEENQRFEEKMQVYKENVEEMRGKSQDYKEKIEEMKRNEQDFIINFKRSDEIWILTESELLNFKEKRKNDDESLRDLESRLKELQEMKDLLKKTLQDKSENQLQQFISEKTEELTKNLESQTEENCLIQHENLELLEEILKESTFSHFLSKQLILSQISIESDETISIINKNSSLETEILSESNKNHKNSESLSSLQLFHSKLKSTLHDLQSSTTSMKESKKATSSFLNILQQEYQDSKILFDFHKTHLPVLETRYSSLLSQKSSLQNSLLNKKGLSSFSQESSQLSSDLEIQNHENLLLEKENFLTSEEIQKLLNETQEINEKILSFEILKKNSESDSLISTSTSKYSPEEEEKIRDFRQKAHENKIKINELKILLEGHAIHKKRSLLDTEKGADPSSRPCARCLTF